MVFRCFMMFLFVVLSDFAGVTPFLAACRREKARYRTSRQSQSYFLCTFFSKMFRSREGDKKRNTTNHQPLPRPPAGCFVAMLGILRSRPRCCPSTCTPQVHPWLLRKLNGITSFNWLLTKTVMNYAVSPSHMQSSLESHRKYPEIW